MSLDMETMQGECFLQQDQVQPAKEQWNIDKRETSWFISKNEHVFEKCFEVMCLFSFQKLDTEPENGLQAGNMTAIVNTSLR